MTRPFAPRDTLRLLRQQGAGTALEIEAALLFDQTPIRQMLGAWWPVRRTLETYVLALPDGGDGFLQARCRAGAPEADITFIAPSLAGRDGAALYWSRLINESCQHLAGAGIQRVFVALSERDRVALHLFQQSGFKVYTTDTVFRRRDGFPPLPQPQAEAADGLRPASSADAWAIQQLRLANCPRDVRGHEIADLRSAGAGYAGTNAAADASDEVRGRTFSAGDADPWGGYPLGGHLPLGSAGWVRPDGLGGLSGAARLTRGRIGHWLQLAAPPDADWDDLLRAVLAAAARLRWPAGPVHATARGYEPQLNAALRAQAFQPLMGRFRLVRHMAVRVLEPAWSERAVADPATAT